MNYEFKLMTHHFVHRFRPPSPVPQLKQKTPSISLRVPDQQINLTQPGDSGWIYLVKVLSEIYSLSHLCQRVKIG